MDFHFYASLLDLCQSHGDDLKSYLSTTKGISDYNLSPLLVRSAYKFLSNKSQIFLIIFGSISGQGLQISIKETPHVAFKVLEDLKAQAKIHPFHKIIGIGYSSGASILSALADVYKNIDAYCFNPIGLGKNVLGAAFYEKYSLTPEIPNVTVIRTLSDTFSKNFTLEDPSKISNIEHKEKFHPHSLQNFLLTSDFQIDNISKIFPSISQISFSPETGFILLETEESLSNYYIEGDIATIFYMVYSHPKEFSFTLVPADKANPGGLFQKKVFTPDELEGTLIGHYLWEADWKLKQLDLGLFYDDFTMQKSLISAEIPWFKCGFDFYSEVEQERNFIRLWFINEKVDFEYANTKTGITIRPGDIKIRVAAKKLVQDPNAEFGLADTESDHTAYKFAQYLSENFEKISQEIPELLKLKQLALLVSLAEFFRDTLKVPREMLNLDLLKARITKVEDFYEEGKVPRLVRKEERIEGDYAITLSVTGGVSMLAQKSTPVYNAELIKSLNRAEEYLTPFRITQFDYMKELLEYQDTKECESTEMSAVSLFLPQCCSEDICNNMVIPDCSDVDVSPSDVFFEISPYSYLGKLYCKKHHPFRCWREKCQKIIMPGQQYAQMESGKIHSECLICEHCKQPIVSQFIVRNGLYHAACINKIKDFNTELIKPIEKPIEKLPGKNAEKIVEKNIGENIEKPMRNFEENKGKDIEKMLFLEKKVKVDEETKDKSKVANPVKSPIAVKGKVGACKKEESKKTVGQKQGAEKKPIIKNPKNPENPSQLKKK